MVLVKHRQYFTTLVDPLLLGPINVNAALRLFEQQAPIAVTSHATMLRTRAELQVGAAVGPPGADIPPEQWWQRSQVLLYAYWSPTPPATTEPFGGTSEHYLGSAVLRRTLVASPSAPSEYYVTYQTDDALVTETSRKGTDPTIRPVVSWYVGVSDPTFALSQGYAGVSLWAQLRTFVLWGDTA